MFCFSSVSFSSRKKRKRRRGEISGTHFEEKENWYPPNLSSTDTKEKGRERGNVPELIRKCAVEISSKDGTSWPLTILRSSFFGGVGGFVAVAEEVGGGESFGFSTLAEDARVIWFPARLRDCFCCLRVNELVVELNCLVKDCVANIMDEMVSLLKKVRAQGRKECRMNFRKRCGSRVSSFPTVTRR